MSDKISIFGEALQTPRALRPGGVMPTPTPRLQQLLAMGMLVTLMAGSFGIIYYLDDESPAPPGGDELPGKGDDVFTPLLSERTRTSAQLTGFDSCAAMEGDLKDAIREEMLVDLGTYRYNYYWRNGDMMFDGAETLDGEGAPQAGGEKRVEGEDYSGTNNQEQGVDEADFVKTDGHYIYLLNGQKLEIMGVPEIGQLTYESNLTIEGSPIQMLMANDFMVVFSSVSAYNLPDGDPLRELLVKDEVNYWWRTTSLTKITVVDMIDRANPVVARELYLEGWYKTAREVDGTVRLVSYGYLDTPGLRYWPELPDRYYELDWDDPERNDIWNSSIEQTIEQNEEIIADYTPEDMVPQIYERRSDGNFLIHAFTANECGDFIIAEDGMSRGFTSILTLDLINENFAYEADHIMSNWAEIYASTNVLLVAERAQDWWWFWNNNEFEEATNIHSFDISEPGKTTYTGSGRVNGTVLDQFSLSEYNGFLRIATTSGQWNRWWMDTEEQTGPENHVWVLAPAVTREGEEFLAQVGHLGGIAIGERIWTNRFVGDKGYMVTFRNIDPLWTIDLSNPTDPRIKGELEVPGVSTYIHPMDEEHLLTIGIGPNDEEDGLDWRITQLSQFDVTDFEDPQLLDVLPLTPVVDDGDQGWSWAWSEATYEHKAFQYWKPLNMLAIPLSTYRYTEFYDSDNDRKYWKYEYVSKLMLINAESGETMAVHGELDHSEFYDNDRYNWYSWGYNIRRSVFMFDKDTDNHYVYAISAGGVTSHLITDTGLELQEALPLDPEWEKRYYHMDG